MSTELNLESIRESRISTTTRRTYATSISQFIIYLWMQKRHLLEERFIQMVLSESTTCDPTEFVPSKKLIRSRLPGLCNIER